MMRIGAETDNHCNSAIVDFTLLEHWPYTWIFNPAVKVNSQWSVMSDDEIDFICKDAQISEIVG